VKDRIFCFYETERKVLKALLEKYKEKTVIFVAHRLSSIREFERILVLENGKIAEEGGHEELLKKGGIYSSLWKSQEKSIEFRSEIFLKDTSLKNFSSEESENLANKQIIEKF